MQGEGERKPPVVSFRARAAQGETFGLPDPGSQGSAHSVAHQRRPDPQPVPDPALPIPSPESEARNGRVGSDLVRDLREERMGFQDRAGSRYCFVGAGEVAERWSIWSQ